ncbi:HAD family hydrolase [Caballeronia arvi]|nr:HAD family hydrolase [Caballeronia arvi]
MCSPLAEQTSSARALQATRIVRRMQPSCESDPDPDAKRAVARRAQSAPTAVCTFAASLTLSIMIAASYMRAAEECTRGSKRRPVKPRSRRVSGSLPRDPRHEQCERVFTLAEAPFFTGGLMLRAAIFDVDGTLVDSVDLHALAWCEAFAHFGHDVSFEEVRSQIGKGGDKLLPVFLSEAELREQGEQLETWRSQHFKANYLTMVRPFSAVPDVLRKLRDQGTRIAVGSSAKKDELKMYLDIAGIADLLDVTVSSEDVDRSKPDPDVFETALHKLCVEPLEAIVVGDSPYDAQAAKGAGLQTIGLLSGGFSEESLRNAGCIAVYPGPAALLAKFDPSLFGG